MTKRKRNSLKFYAVRVGHKRGIYHSWDECAEQVKGFKGAFYKSFSTRQEAEAFISENGSEVPVTQSRRGSKFYAVRRGRSPGIYRDWDSTSEQVNGFSKSSYQCFDTYAAAQRFMEEPDKLPPSPHEPNTETEWRRSGPRKPRQHMVKNENALEEDGETPEGTTADTTSCKIKKEDAMEKQEPSDLAGEDPGELGEDGFDSSVVYDSWVGCIRKKNKLECKTTKSMPRDVRDNSVIIIYTDGSARGNGNQNAIAGIGVYFGPGDKRNISEPLLGSRQTNQRAELVAILRALETVPKNRHAELFSDSQYAVNCVTRWRHKWHLEKNGWVNGEGNKIENGEIVDLIVRKEDERRKAGAKTVYRWIKGHADIEGNVEADKLAVQGSKRGAVA